MATTILQEKLIEKGVVVITNVLNQEECDKINQGYLNDLKGLLSSPNRNLASVNPKGQNGNSLWKNLGAPLTKNAQNRRTNLKVKNMGNFIPNRIFSSIIRFIHI